MRWSGCFHFATLLLLISIDFRVYSIFEDVPDDHSTFPKYIRPFPVRKDIRDHAEVVRGRLEILGGLLSESPLQDRNKVSFDEFNAALQANLTTVILKTHNFTLFLLIILVLGA